MESFGKNSFENKTNPSKVENTVEKLDVKIELAQPDDWEVCKKMKWEAITGEDAHKFGVTPETKEMEAKKGEKEWRDELSNPNMITFLSKNGDDTIGMGRAKKQEECIWRLHNGFVEKEFRDKGIGKKIFQARLNEIIKRGGKKVITLIEITNKPSIHIAESFGFKKRGPSRKKYKFEWQVMELDLESKDKL